MQTAACDWVRRFLGPWKDGELDPADAARIENHIAACTACASQARFEKWFSGEVRRRVERPQAPARLADRISLELRREFRRQRVRRTAFALGGLAAAAGLAVVVAFGLRDSPTAQPPDGVRAAVSSETGAGGAPPSTPPAPTALRYAALGEPGVGPTGELASDIVDRHERAVRQALPSASARFDDRGAADWFQGKLSFPVVAPRFADPDVRLLGGGLTDVRGQDAAYLGYDVGGRRMSVIVLPSGAARIDGTPVAIGDRTVRVLSRGWATAVVLERNGLVYALVSGAEDVSPERLLRLAGRIE